MHARTKCSQRNSHSEQERKYIKKNTLWDLIVLSDNSSCVRCVQKLFGTNWMAGLSVCFSNLILNREEKEQCTAQRMRNAITMACGTTEWESERALNGIVNIKSVTKRWNDKKVNNVIHTSIFIPYTNFPCTRWIPNLSKNGKLVQRRMRRVVQWEESDKYNKSPSSRWKIVSHFARDAWNGSPVYTFSLFHVVYWGSKRQ